MPHPSFSLVIPLWNEERNLESLVQMIEASDLLSDGLNQVILVNNGSTDKTGQILNDLSSTRPWISPIYLKQNQNYGGGVYEGCCYSINEIVAYIPGDLQVQCNDVTKIWHVFRNEHLAGKRNLLIKGMRTIRFDPIQTRLVSLVYTIASNLILSLKIRDVNGLPKFFNITLLDLVPSTRMRTFVFDAQLISLARHNNWSIQEIPVTFHARRSGVSSWSKKRMLVYRESFINLFRLRKLRLAPGIPLERKQQTLIKLQQNM